jgi:hypothetical protein
MDIIRLYQNFSIPIAPDGDKHSRPGWVNVECPFCVGNPGYHLGWNEQEEYFYCWRCGWHPPIKTLSTLLKVPDTEAQKLLKVYGANTSFIERKVKERKPLILPYGTSIGGVMPVHYDYLKQRRFNAEEIIEKWKLKGTGPIGELDKIDYRFRLIIPYFWNGQMVSFDSRDVTGKQSAKYKACPGEREKVPHKDILYGMQEEWGEVGICVEGPTDVWRLGKKAFAVSGIEYTKKQVRVIAQTFRRVAVMFDDEPQAQRQAKKLVADLRFRNVDAWNVKVKGDPGGLNRKEAKELIKSIMK